VSSGTLNLTYSLTHSLRISSNWYLAYFPDLKPSLLPSPVTDSSDHTQCTRTVQRDTQNHFTNKTVWSFCKQNSIFLLPNFPI